MIRALWREEASGEEEVLVVLDLWRFVERDICCVMKGDEEG